MKRVFVVLSIFIFQVKAHSEGLKYNCIGRDLSQFTELKLKNDKIKFGDAEFDYRDAKETYRAGGHKFVEFKHIEFKRRDCTISIQRHLFNGKDGVVSIECATFAADVLCELN